MSRSFELEITTEIRSSAFHLRGYLSASKHAHRKWLLIRVCTVYRNFTVPCKIVCSLASPYFLKPIQGRLWGIRCCFHRSVYKINTTVFAVDFGGVLNLAGDKALMMVQVQTVLLIHSLIASERNALRERSRRRKIKSESEMYWFFGLTRYCNAAGWLLIAFFALRSLHTKNPACNKAPRKRFVSVKQTGQNYVGYSLCLSCKPQEPFTVSKISKWLHRNSRFDHFHVWRIWK